MLRKVQYCCWTSFVGPSVCNVAVFIVLWAYVLDSYFESILLQEWLPVVVKICHTKGVYFYRAMLRKAQYNAVERRLSVRLSVTLLYSLYCGRMW